ncbi:tRNA (5-methylaminomethyl-2-thiouridine)(34)-methyltransferase MnmD [Hyphobacterium marinum]|uniref:tRNA 5-methylaminomethyl-2-thiouridine biosynthesis bifunctional protein MnmC n=1 Tax=Hyphobacterium marinum TaxID=3116574 RepID=A0ABU7LY86_9PROT|nr:tRNA (5-methylaminomethyl-2-thiouridine)(34)-methyltransferase MnmD [Hyphobacterium sp. Y6023]MEE2566511.1 tRNA (5-methylaminomethyl-2-thiouridine)(34)-methyltransferase MnmD [Hyphobacterium sp. Y6023]
MRLKLFYDPPDLDWTGTGPVARGYDDVYFSAEDGLAETRAVFLEGCGLPGAWAGRKVFTVAELGFGTGLNALALWDLWRRHRPAGAQLHFISIEKHPFPREAARRALAAWPELATLSQHMLAQWPTGLKGAHRMRFDADGFVVTLFQDEAEAALSQIEAEVDAWFLDGFAPAKNAAMWADSIFSHMARLSQPGARVATFTVAGHVRRGLQAAGFTVEKKPGFGRKRERLEAVFAGPPSEPPDTEYPRTSAVDGPVAILGGGIAGASIAQALSQRGREAVIFDPKELAGGASGAPSGLLTPRLEKADRPHVRATLAAFEYARGLYERLGVFVPEGALRLAKDDADAARLATIADAMCEGYAFDEGRNALWMDRAGRFDPAAVVRALAKDTPVLTRDFDPKTDDFAVIVHATGPALPLDGMSASAGRIVLAKGQPPHTPLVWGGYVSASPDGRVLIGATHARGADPGPEDEAATKLLNDLRDRVPGIASGLDTESLDHWSGIRAVTPDRLPVAGTEDRKLLLGGFGSRGFAHAPLLAETLASDLCGEPSPLEKSGREALHPARFRIRAERRSG